MYDRVESLSYMMQMHSDGPTRLSSRPPMFSLPIQLGPKGRTLRGKQTYPCGDPLHRFTPDGNRHYYPEHVNERALDMHEDGSSIAAISRVMGVGKTTVYSWVRKGVLGSGDGVPRALHARGSDA